MNDNTPIHVIIARLKRIPLRLQIEHLRALVLKEPVRSIRRRDLQQLLADKMAKQLRREIRADKRARA